MKIYEKEADKKREKLKDKRRKTFNKNNSMVCRYFREGREVKTMAFGPKNKHLVINAEEKKRFHIKGQSGEI